MKNLSELDPQNFPEDWLDRKDNGILVMEIIIEGKKKKKNLNISYPPLNRCSYTCTS